MADSIVETPSARATNMDVPAVSLESNLAVEGPDWAAEDAYWQSAYPGRPYARADRGYEYYRLAYRYGGQAAMRDPDREWREAERDLQQGWIVRADSPESAESQWEEMRDAIRDAWDHVRGRSDDERTHIR